MISGRPSCICCRCLRICRSRDQPEGLPEILDQVVGILDADRQSNEPIADPSTEALVARQPRVRCDCRTCDQRANAAEARGDRWQRHFLDELVGLLGGAAQLKAQHTAEAAEELAGARVARMALEAGAVAL